MYEYYKIKEQDRFRMLSMPSQERDATMKREKKLNIR